MTIGKSVIVVLAALLAAGCARDERKAVIAQIIADSKDAVSAITPDNMGYISEAITGNLDLLAKTYDIQELPPARISIGDWKAAPSESAKKAEILRDKDEKKIQGLSAGWFGLLAIIPILLSRFLPVLPQPLAMIAGLLLGQDKTKLKTQDKVISVLDKVKLEMPDNPVFAKLSKEMTDDEKAYIKGRHK
jgi:hypothetical protein